MYIEIEVWVILIEADPHLAPFSFRLACNAFRTVIGRRQTKYGNVLEWVDEEIRQLDHLRKIRHGRLSRIKCA